MRAPFNGTKAKVVGFFRGLFGKSDQEATEVRDETVYDYSQVAPVTGAQLKAPAPTAQPVVSVPKISSRPQPAHIHAAATTAATAGHQEEAASGFSISDASDAHVNGVVLSPKGVAVKPTGQPTTVPNPPKAVTINLGKSHSTQITARPTPKPAAAANSSSVNVSLAAIMATLPAELQARVVRKEYGNHVIPIPLEVAFAQLASGIVRIPFGTVRENAPQFFTPGADADQSMVVLPLGEVLRQINPAQFAKPENQVRITADADVTSPFADKGKHQHLEVKSSTPTRSITPVPMATPESRSGGDAVPKPHAPGANAAPPIRINVPPPPASSPTKPVAPAPSPLPHAPIAMPKPQTPAPGLASLPIAVKPASPKPAPSPGAPIPMAKAPAAAPPPAPVSPPATPGPASPKGNGAIPLRLVASPPEAAPASGPAPSPAPKPAVPAPPPASPATAARRTLTVALKSLVDAWPEVVKKELLDQKLGNSSVNLPTEAIAAQLKNGRVAFQWESVRTWMSPRPSSESAHGALELELPLHIIAPLFLGLKNTDTARAQRVTADDHIPDFFAPIAKPAAAPAAAPTANTATPKLEPAPAAMSPEDIVKRAAALGGVAGVLIALQDGLVVASKLPPKLSADSLAAFLPQIYAKFDACLKDLKMDGLNNLNFTAGNVPWRVFRTGSVFFVAFGRANEPLPNDWLTTLAGELEKK